MADIFFIAIAFYILYKVVVDFILPVYRTTVQVKSQFKHMHDSRQEQHTEFHQQQKPAQEKDKNNGKIGEYIDFEEVNEK
jgi:hypothetical protein